MVYSDSVFQYTSIFRRFKLKLNIVDRWMLVSETWAYGFGLLCQRILVVLVFGVSVSFGVLLPIPRRNFP